MDECKNCVESQKLENEEDHPETNGQKKKKEMWESRQCEQGVEETKSEHPSGNTCALLLDSSMYIKAGGTASLSFLQWERDRTSQTA